MEFPTQVNLNFIPMLIQDIFKVTLNLGRDRIIQIFSSYYRQSLSVFELCHSSRGQDKNENV